MTHSADDTTAVVTTDAPLVGTSTPRKHRHPLLKDCPPGVWSPTAAASGKVTGYPKTQADYDRRVAALRANHAAAKAKGKLTRLGVPNDWRGQKEEINAIRHNSQCAAERLADDLTTIGVLSQETVDDAMAREAITALAAVVYDTTQKMTMRLTAMKILLPYIRPKPTQRTAVTVDGGLAFLSGLSATARGDGRESVA